MPSPVCLVCTGKHCRREPGHAKLLAALESVTSVERVRCQDICKGPVVGVEVTGRVEWFRKVRKGRHRAAAVDLLMAGTDEIPSALADRRVAKRAGKVRR